MVAEQRITLSYAPRKVFRSYHDRTERFSCIVAHRRCGKTVACINDIGKRAITLDKPHGRYAYIAPLLSQGKEVAWEYIKRFQAPLIADKNEGELWVELVNGARIRIHGADNPDRLRGGYLDGVVMDEFADMRPSVWGEVIRPMLADRGGWGTFIGTPKGRNAFHAIHERAQAEPSWFSLVLKASATKLLSQNELDEARRDMTPEQYEQEFECSFEAAITGAYYGRELAEADREGRLTSVPIDESTPVHTAWDLGMGDSTAIWFFQIVGAEIHIVDHYENSGLNLEHYLGVLKDRGYAYGTDFLPQDAKARELIAGRSRVEYLTDKGRQLHIVSKHGVEDGINASRLALPRCYFDKTRCSAGIEALRQYRTEYDEKARAFKNNPRHDWTSHSADAFRYLAMGWREYDKPQPVTDKLKEMVKPKTLDQLIKEYEMAQEDD